MDRRKLQSDVLEQLQWEPGVNSADIGVTVKSGVVALSGKVDSLAKKSAIETEIHSSVEGAREPNATDEPKHGMGEFEFPNMSVPQNGQRLRSGTIAG